MKQKGQAKQNTKKELKQMLNWTRSIEFNSTGCTGDLAPVYPVGFGYTGVLPPVHWTERVEVKSTNHRCTGYTDGA